MKTTEDSAQHAAQLLSALDSAQSIDEQCLWEIVDILGSTDDLDVAFCAWAPEGSFVHVYGMDIIQAIEVFFQASGCELFGQGRQVVRRCSQRQEMAEILRKLVSVLQEQTNITFCLAWRFHGEHAVTLHHSLDLSWKNAKKHMFDYLTVELAEAVGLCGPIEVEDDEFANVEVYAD